MGGDQVLQHRRTGGFFDLSTWIIAIIGSVVLQLIYHAITSGTLSTNRRRSARR